VSARHSRIVALGSSDGTGSPRVVRTRPRVASAGWSRVTLDLAAALAEIVISAAIVVRNSAMGARRLSGLTSVWGAAGSRERGTARDGSSVPGRGA
jgi:hypothetical protein